MRVLALYELVRQREHDREKIRMMLRNAEERRNLQEARPGEQTPEII